jgi:DNA polymerase-1
VKAAAILDEWYGPEADEVYKAECAWKFGVVPAYEAKGLTADDALVQARVSKILQHTDYNFTRKEPILWTPPQ